MSGGTQPHPSKLEIKGPGLAERANPKCVKQQGSAKGQRVPGPFVIQALLPGAALQAIL